MSYRPKKPKSQNPLAVVAALIGVIELAFAYPVTVLSGPNQTHMVWFMMLFPTLLMLCFFGTVWFRPGHLYSPKDYKKDETFLAGIGKMEAGPARELDVGQKVKDFDFQPEEDVK